MSLERELVEGLDDEVSSLELDASDTEEVVEPVRVRANIKEMEKEVEDEAMEIESLIKNGIGMSDINKLKASGVCSVKAVHMSTRRNLCKIKGISEAKVDKIKEAASKIMVIGQTSDFLLKRKSVLRLSTGSHEFNKLLGGGVQTMSITEAFGEFRTGKTQLAHTLCVTCQLPANMGGGGGKAAYIDTEGTFRPERIREVATRFNLEPDAVLDNIIYARAYNSEHQFDLLLELTKRFMDEKCFRLLVVDSIIALFRTDFSGRGELGERQQKLNQFLSKLIKLADEFNLAVFITNQMSSDPGAVMSFVSDPKKPVGGHVLAHASTTRLSLKKGRAEERIVKVYDSPDLPEAEARYTITKGGISDLSE